ncbi:MAG: cysteine desulfurase [Acidobacteria bacterium]|nr:cysteine desulfurase [Acidobacteriota bacterium]
MDRRVLGAMLPYLENEWGNPSSPYRFAARARLAVERARHKIAECSGCRPEEIIFTSSGTESDNLAVRGTAYALGSRGRHIVTTAIEHHAVLNTCRALEKDGFRVTYLPVDHSGAVRIEELERSLTAETVLVTVMHANNETGVLQPVREIAALVKRRGIPFHTDAVQTAGKMPYPVCGLGADLISLSGHKLYGPKGAAALFVRETTPMSPILTGGMQEKGRRAGTENVAGIVGLAHAFSLSASLAEEEYKRLETLRDRFEQRVLASIPSAKINGAGAPRIPNTTNISFDSVDGESIVLGLDLEGVCASTGSACSTGDPEPSHVLLAMGLSSKEAQGSIRISLGRESDEKGMDAAFEALSRTVVRLRSISSV